MVPTQEKAASDLPTEDEQNQQDKQEEVRFSRKHRGWAIVVSLITALASLAVAVARIIEALSAGSKC
jgi:hypothetical protein